MEAVNKSSIYEKIRDCIERNGVVPDGFELEEREYKENELRFAPGALEGILGHHSAGAGAGQALAEKIKEYLQIIPKEAMEKFEREAAVDGQMASARSGIQKVILERKDEYDAGKVFALAYFFAMNGNMVETVKLGLSLLALFDTGDKGEVCDVLRTLGCCEEFTDYVLTAVESWAEKDKQELYFDLARKLHGWGKINAVERMYADTEEKKEWLLCHGCKNSIMNAYLGLVCAEKCDFQERLKQGNFSEEQFQGAREIMDGLLDEGPCQGLSAMEDAAELVLLYLEECRKHVLNVDLVMQLADIRDYFDGVKSKAVKSETAGVNEADSDTKIRTKVETMISTIHLKDFIVEHMKDSTYQCIRIARAFELDVSECLIGLMKMNFAKYYPHCYYLFEKNAYVDDFFHICERAIKEADYPNEMGDSWGVAARERKGIMLDMIVQYLDRYPLCGKKMIRICLHSPITRWRNMAGKALLGWVKELGGTLADIDSELYDVVEDVAARECNEGTKETWKKLLGR